MIGDTGSRAVRTVQNHDQRQGLVARIVGLTEVEAAVLQVKAAHLGGKRQSSIVRMTPIKRINCPFCAAGRSLAEDGGCGKRLSSER